MAAKSMTDLRKRMDARELKVHVRVFSSQYLPVRMGLLGENKTVLQTDNTNLY